ncbi:MAG TPA: sigma-70 family RNA polymerase sigma factor [Vicinamibacterales bacterium]|nr:sigma-70 family RNA polymerase sigma factor [Vicinamibacterales bacterium]
MHTCSACSHFVAGICNAASASRPAPCADECRIGRRDADLTTLFERYHRHVVAWACRMSGSYELATDLAQDVFIKAWAAWDRFRGASQFSTWLYTITRNCYRDHMRARAARPREVDDRVLTTDPPVVENDAIAALEAEHAAALVRSLMRDARLDPVEARAFVMHYRDDVPLRDVTARLGLTNPSGARAQIVSATRKLRRSAQRCERLSARGVAAARGHASP